MLSQKRAIYEYSLEAVLDGVEGWFFQNEANELMRLASEVKPPYCIVEIGAYRGRSTLSICKGLQEGVRFYSIDPRLPCDGFEFKSADRVVFEKNLATWNVQDLVFPISLPAEYVGWNWQKFYDTPVGLLFVDGNHSTQNVVNEIRAWTSPASEAKWMFHDANGETVIAALAQFDNLVTLKEVDISRVCELRKG